MNLLAGGKAESGKNCRPSGRAHLFLAPLRSPRISSPRLGRSFHFFRRGRPAYHGPHPLLSLPPRTHPEDTSHEMGSG